MSWPADDISTADLDAGADTPPRATFFRMARAIKAIIAGRGVADGIASLGAEGKVPDAQLGRGLADGVASLGGGGKVPDDQLPPRPKSYVPASGVIQSGAGNAVIELNPIPAPTAYTAGDTYEFVLEDDISADASINVSALGIRQFVFKPGSRIASLAGGHVVRAVYDGTRFLLGSLVAAVLSATAVEFTASDSAYAWPYAAPKALAVIDGAGGGAAGGGPQLSGPGNRGGDGAAASANGNSGDPGDGGAPGGGDGGGASAVSVGGNTYYASGGGGGSSKGDTPNTAGDAGVANPQNNYEAYPRPSGPWAGISGGGGDGAAGGLAPFSNQGDGGNGVRVVQIISGLSVGTILQIQIGIGGPGGEASSGGTPGGDGSDGKVTLYPLWA